MDPLENVPVKILGFSIKTRWQITLNYLIPSIIELLVYLSVMVVDGALVYQHLRDRNSLWAWWTLGFVIVAPVLTFVCVLMSDQWPIESGFKRKKWAFLGRQVTNLLLFPICATYRSVIESYFSYLSLSQTFLFTLAGSRVKYSGVSIRSFMNATHTNDIMLLQRRPSRVHSSFIISSSPSSTAPRKSFCNSLSSSAKTCLEIMIQVCIVMDEISRGHLLYVNDKIIQITIVILLFRSVRAGNVCSLLSNQDVNVS
jgi:hypothetical protein